MTRETLARIMSIIRDSITYETVGTYRHQAVCRCGRWQSMAYGRIGLHDTEQLTRAVWSHAFAHFRFTDPPTIADEYSHAVTNDDTRGRIAWGRRIPAVLFRPPPELDVTFATVLDDTGRSLPPVSSALQMSLWLILVQDAAAVRCGMAEDQRVTCGEHGTWRTSLHLAESHACPPRRASVTAPSRGRGNSR